ncbi:triose-phosphate isomerase [Cereibacter sp. SYSU M97828]|nr:triose-phosphate isomerase [Cereibacter flavus]
MRKLAAGNWKMNGLAADLAEIEAIAAGAPEGCEVLICPPATLLARAAALGLAVGGQDCHAKASGAHTGDVSAAMLADAGAGYVILGHSERRADHGETSEDVAAKALAAQGAGLTAIVCVGETEAERDAGRTLDVIGAQIVASIAGLDPSRLVVAYEPVWAIGTGLTPTLQEIGEVHAFLRARTDVPLLYGGSVKPGNAAEIFAVPDVDGALVGGASLKAGDFLAIAKALASA